MDALDGSRPEAFGVIDNMISHPLPKAVVSVLSSRWY